jgi:hypothetical protein
MAENKEEHANRAARQVYATMEQARAVQSRYWAEAFMRSDVSERLKHRMRSTLMDYYKIMKQFADEDAIEDEWAAAGFDEFGEWATERITVRIPRKGMGRGSKIDETRRINQMEPDRCDELIDALHELAYSLGFRAETNAPPKETSITQDQIDDAINKIKSKT